MAGVLLIMALLLALLCWMVYAITVDRKVRPPAEARAARLESAIQARLLARSARLLEAGLNDPMYRQSAEWTEIAREIVDDYNEGD